MFHVAPPAFQATVLVVEDDPELCVLYRTALIAAGYSVITVEDGIDALRRAESNLPDLVVLDMTLPRLAGRDVQQELRSHPETRHIPIVIASGTDTRDLALVQKDCLLRKPFSADDLVAAVDRCLKQFRHRTR